MKTRGPGAMAVAAAGAAALSAQLTAQTAWTELRAETFVVRGRIAVEALRAVACDVETVARALRHTAGSAPTGAVPAVIAVDSARGIRELLPQFWERRGPRPLGGYWSGLYGHHIAVRVDARPDERLRRVLHEYAHFVTHLAHPEPPRWLDEGLSGLWEHAAVQAGAIELGRPVAGHLKRLRSGKHWIPIDELVSATALPASDARTPMFYAQSWALVHYLMFERPGGGVILDRLPEPDAVPADEELRHYVRGPMGNPVTVSIPPRAGPECPVAATVRRVPHLEALTFTAQALADGERPEAAVPLLARALRLDPGDAEALETLGFVHFQGNRPREAAAVFDQVIAAGNASHIGYYYRALLAGPVPQRSDGSGSVQPLEYLKTAVRLNPRFAPARERLREVSGKLPLAR